MLKKMKIEGMSCEHCANRVEQALSAIPGVAAQVDWVNNMANITLQSPVDDEKLKQAVEDAGYTVVGITA